MIRDENKNANSVVDILSATMENCIKEANRTEFSTELLKSYMEPVFKKHGFRSETIGSVENILVIRLDEIGDNVLTSGFLRELRRNYPHAHITLIVNPTVFQLVEFCPYVNEVIKFTVTDTLHFGMRLFEIVKLCSEKLWHNAYTRAFLPRWDKDSSYFAVFLAYISGAKERIGYSVNVYEDRKKTEGALDALLTSAIITPPDIVHEAARNFYLLTAYNLRVEDTRMELWHEASDYNRMKKRCREFARGRKIIAVAFGANLKSKVYPPEKLARALKKIKNKDNCFILLGGEREKKMGEDICKMLSGDAVNWAGETSLRETAAVLRECSLYIGMDTGAKHMAAALGLPIIEISRAALTQKITPISHIERFAPWQTQAIIIRPKKFLPPCDETNFPSGCSKIKEMHCISQIEPDEIVEAYNQLSKTMVK